MVIKTKEKIFGWQIVLFFIWPFFSLIHALANYKKDYSRYIVWLFTIFFGLTFVLREDSGDALRYAEKLYMMHHSLSFSGLKGLLLVSGGYTDLYQPLMTFLVSIFTDDPKFLFATFGLVLGYFYSRNLSFVLNLIGNNKNRFIFILVFFLAFIIHIGSGINGVRMWTGAHAFIFGALTYFYSENRKGIYICLLSVFFHFSLLLPFVLLLLGIFFKFKINIKLVYTLFILSFVFAEANFELGRKVVENLPGVYEERASKYVSEGVESHLIKTGGRERHWSSSLSNFSLKTIAFLMVSFIFIFYKRIRWDKNLENLFIFSVLFFSISNYFSMIPSLGRYMKIALFLIAFLYICLYAQRMFVNKPIFSLSLFPFLIGFMLFQLRVFLEYPSVWLLIGNPLVAVLFESETTIYSLIF